MGSRKKLLGIGLFAVGSLMFAACGGSDAATEPVQVDTTAAADGPVCEGTETIKIARNNCSSHLMHLSSFRNLQLGKV
jgi:hypothetical protein